MRALNDFIFVKFKTRKSLFAKTIKRDDGTEVELILSSDNFFGSKVNYSGQVGSYKQLMLGTVVLDNKNTIAKIGDTAIVDGMVDENDEYIVSDLGVRNKLGIKSDEVLLSFSAKSKFYKETKWTEGLMSKPQMIHEAGETMWGFDEFGRQVYENKLIAIERNGRIINNKPFLIVEYVEEHKVLKTLTGIVYKEQAKKNIVVKDVETGNDLYTKMDKLLPVNGKQNWFYMEERDILATV